MTFESKLVACLQSIMDSGYTNDRGDFVIPATGNEGEEEGIKVLSEANELLMLASARNNPSAAPAAQAKLIAAVEAGIYALDPEAALLERGYSGRDDTAAALLLLRAELAQLLRG
ncbi:MAG: hypothetical protein E6Q76_08220 [Rhizobium sp.]|nr:MAG: hypothetical protein E6Q76_08220 [Rhizobium sp.]